jgi:ElaB/YqjD/DUF883 family membrane-anchored ribosome-binding protein
VNERRRGTLISIIQAEGLLIDENRIAGTAKNTAGKTQESFGRGSDDYGKARDEASDVANATSKVARDTASSFEKALRDTIENQPYTAVAIALGLGWLLGRMHRPF